MPEMLDLGVWRGRFARKPTHGQKTLFRGRLVGLMAGILAALLTGSEATHADVISWVNPDGGDYDENANWQNNDAPGSNDIAVFDLDGTYTVSSSSNNNRSLEGLQVLAGDVSVHFTDILNLRRLQVDNTGYLIGGTPGVDASLTLRFGNFTSSSSSSTQFLIGGATDARGSVTVGVNAQWAQRGGSLPFTVGGLGEGHLLVEANGFVETQDLVVGDDARGILEITDRALLVAERNVVIGGDFGGHGNVIVKEAGELRLSDTFRNLSVGGDRNDPLGVGHLRIEDAGTVRLADNGVVTVWPGGHVEMHDGTLRADDIRLLGGSLDWQGGDIFGSAGGPVQQFRVGGLDVVGADPPASELTIHTGKDLEISGAMVIASGSRLRLEGGELSVGSIDYQGDFEFAHGKLALTDSALAVEPDGLLGDDVRLAADMELSVFRPLSVASGARLTVEGGRVEAIGALDISAGGELLLLSDASHISGGQLTNQGLLRGTGRVENELLNDTVGVVRVDRDDRLRFTGGGENRGDITLADGAVLMDGKLTNTALGRVLGHGMLTALGGIDSTGRMLFSAGVSEVQGDVNLLAGSTTVVAPQSTVTFFDDVISNGDVFRVRPEGTAVVMGTLSGGTGVEGGGTVIVEGTLAPGMSPGDLSFAGDLVLGLFSRTELEIGGLEAGTEHDQVTVGGTFTAAGTLEVSLVDAGQGLFAPAFGDLFQVLAFGQSTGAFDEIIVPELSDALAWQTAGLLQGGTLQVVSALPGDVDGNGAVSLDDFVQLRENFGSNEATWLEGDLTGDGRVGLADFTILKDNFGSVLPAAAVPEPSSLLLAVLAIVFFVGVRLRRQAQ